MKRGIICTVLYNTTLSQSQTLAFLQSHKVWRDFFDLLVINNDTDITIESDYWYTIINTNENLFLNKAYDIAYQYAKKNGYKWILILDQDTVLNEYYEKELTDAITTEEEASVIIPMVFSVDGIFISPKTYNPSIGFSWGERKITKPGLYTDCFQAINSGTCIKTDAVTKMNGFPKEFPLDGLDIAYFYKLFKNNEPVKVISASIQQNLSVLNLSTMKEWRYESMLAAELQCATILGRFQRLMWKLKLPLRALKRLSSKNGGKFFIKTLKYLLR